MDPKLKLREAEEAAVHKILRDRKMTPFAVQSLGGVLGHLVDCGLTDEEIGTVVVHMVGYTRRILANPETERTLRKLYAGA